MSFIAQIDDQMEQIIRLVHVDRAQGLKALQRLAEQGDRSAIDFLGRYLSEEEETTDLALPWLRKADEFASPDAAWNLAMIARGRGSVDEMRHWIDRAADLGEEDAAAIRENNYDVDAFLASLSE
ncbi:MULTISPECIES: sel1 repeat family protein [unclassified Rhizobium]|uniref:sel1 repeat family protein n=1 Tax=unclassified Rhizobium TaxID=2613769 RepID=UPI0007125152|nr:MULTISPECIES: sel1 repeat family protein [unclassified Rhizobium]KQS88663.1 hypothetical protein ASG42_15795 [Rhizobium sp. Leaf391]KQT05606.1 hypothetical protein ASG50_14650 [Rhizobium sp. Leaf386]KQT91330.1 hypothetical protein ASG68_19700 [Rhizobium sp. Leaf453]